MTGIQEQLAARLAASNGLGSDDTAASGSGLSFSGAEVEWMLENIGCPDPAVRDGLICELWYRGIGEQAFSADQFCQMADFSCSRDLILSGLGSSPTPSDLLPALTRSFAALLNANLIAADAWEDGPYWGLLTAEQRAYLFTRCLDYLDQEQVFAGHSADYGWVHCFAHGGEFAAAAIKRADFPAEQVARLLPLLNRLFHRLPQAFEAQEECRLGLMVVNGLLSGNLAQAQLADWLRQEATAYPLTPDDLIGHSRRAAFEVFVAFVYFHTRQAVTLAPSLDTAFAAVLDGFYYW